MPNKDYIRKDYYLNLNMVAVVSFSTNPLNLVHATADNVCN